MRESMIEVRMSRELALQLGAIEAASLEHHRQLRARGDCLLVRDLKTMQALFWPIIPGADQRPA